MLSREPKPSNRLRGHGHLAVTFQVHNSEKLSEKEKQLVNYDLPSYLRNCLNDIRAKRITPPKKDEFERITAKSLEFCLDVNQVRIKFARPVGDLITLLERDMPCLHEWYKHDIFKSEPTAVDISLWNSVRKKRGM